MARLPAPSTTRRIGQSFVSTVTIYKLQLYNQSRAGVPVMSHEAVVADVNLACFDHGTIVAVRPGVQLFTALEAARAAARVHYLMITTQKTVGSFHVVCTQVSTVSTRAGPGRALRLELALDVDVSLMYPYGRVLSVQLPIEFMVVCH